MEVPSIQFFQGVIAGQKDTAVAGNGTVASAALSLCQESRAQIVDNRRE
jgi:hypothetical protein